VADAAGKGSAAVRAFTGGAFAENTYLVTCEATGSAVLVDPGAAAGDALAAARQAGATVGAILLTHAHIDHVEGLGLAKRETGAPVYLHPADLPLYGAAPAQAEWFGMRMEPLPPVDRELADGDVLGFGACELGVRFTPGHAPGHVVFVGEGFALVGDTVFLGSIGRTDLPGGDLRTLLASIHERILTLPGGTVLHNGHGPQTTVARERAANPFLVAGFAERHG
jgi:hydroxyacylglutathione hydrolase